MDWHRYLVLLLFHCSFLTFLLFFYIWTFYCSYQYIGRQCKWVVLYRTIPHLQCVFVCEINRLWALVHRTEDNSSTYSLPSAYLTNVRSRTLCTLSQSAPVYLVERLSSPSPLLAAAGRFLRRCSLLFAAIPAYSPSYPHPFIRDLQLVFGYETGCWDVHTPLQSA